MQRLRLPLGTADAEKIDARLADGVLIVRLPKSAPARIRRIEITS
ncbi:MAG: Hsp20 family protein [Micromonosporaceae bacterium]